MFGLFFHSILLDFSHFLDFLDFLPFLRLSAIFEAFCHLFLPFLYSVLATFHCAFPETRFSFIFGRLVSRLDTDILQMGS